MSKHTPGPWITLEPNINGPLPRYTTEVITDWTHDDGLFTTICEMPFDFYSVEAASNARLIASAPDLLDALEELLSEYEDHRAQFGDDVLWQKFERVEVIDQARTAIKRARGEL